MHHSSKIYDKNSFEEHARFREPLCTWWKCPVSSGMTQMMGSPMQVSRVIFHDWLTMKNRRKPKRAVYHMTRLSFSLSASLISLVSVVMRDTSSPERRVVL